MTQQQQQQMLPKTLSASPAPPRRLLLTFIVANPRSYSPFWIGLILRLFLAFALPTFLDDGKLLPGVSYTDIDFYVFTDASVYIQQGKSPYDRHTYRYTPFLAALLSKFENIEMSRYLFCVADALCGWIILSLRQNLRRRRNENSSDSKSSPDNSWKANNNNLQDALWWLYNPLAINICTRGSSESLQVLLPVLLTYWMATQHERRNDGNGKPTLSQVILTGICHGIAVHSKLYPIIYSLSYMAYFASAGNTSDKMTRQFPWQSPTKLFRLAKLWIRRLFFQKLPVIFLVTFLATFVALTYLAYYYYGEIALQEGLLYHFGRVDHRHNYSMYWYWIYLARARSEGGLMTELATSSLQTMGKFLLLPQAFLLAYSSVGMAPNGQLGLALFIQTYLFVSHNKVITAQYFTWYLCLLPLCAASINFQSKKLLVPLLLLGLSIITWLLSAYLLEMQGMAVHRIVWVASVAYFFANVNLMGAILQSAAANQQQKDTTSKNVSKEKKRI